MIVQPCSVEPAAGDLSYSKISDDEGVYIPYKDGVERHTYLIVVRKHSRCAVLFFDPNSKRLEVAAPVWEKGYTFKRVDKTVCFSIN